MSDAGEGQAALDLRPLEMGELVDRTAGLWRRHVGPFFRLYLGFALVQYALAKGFVLGMARWAPLFLGGQALATAMSTDPEAVLRQVPAWLELFGAFFVIYSWVNWFSWVVMSDFAVGAWLGRAVSVAGSLRRALRRSGAATLAFGIAALYLVAALIVCMLPGAGLFGLAIAADAGPLATAILLALGGVLVLLGMVAALLWYVLRFLFTCQVLALEELGGLGAIRRSGRLISGRVGRGFLGWVKVRATVLVTVVALLVFTVTFVSGLPALVIQSVYGNLLDPAHATPSAVPQSLLVPAELVQVVVQAVFAPFYIAFAGLFYADMRVRREGLDLELALEREGA
ncbi:MAG TPA: hypothetical protein VIG99_13150 [Myxococcaceae bacterium]